MSQINTAVAFGAGLVSFLSPCVLPLVPGYLSFVAGVSMDQLRNTTAAADGAGEGGAAAPLVNTAVRRHVVLYTLIFVLGFSLVFIALGAAATAVGTFLLAKQKVIAQIAGVIVILFGLHTMGVFKFAWLYQEKRFQVTLKPAGPIGPFVIGVAFAFGWTPCIGPILASILTLAAAEETVGQGIWLLAVYSLGLGIPFMLTALAFSHLMVVFDKVKQHMRTVEIVSGLLLVGVGILLITNSLTVLSAWFQRIPGLNQLAL
ncbi:MAG: sulfite exporter TauE/SafE family protein [Candidatus Sericytochromatia bacterium]|uniref:Sulfite exporter TauE/SafE family protein n=1 Tax=Candidatus Tanganyikabacteria bacterium TaxID=2961651 RepID=A0A937X3C5_9BACT|nr:sulfite exporter TauE/SafE family protein [Candidatus Tanganyikabacteria bacterium]